MQHGTNLGKAEGFLGMTIQTMERVHCHHHPDFQSDAETKIATKAVPKPGPKATAKVVSLARRYAA